MSAGANVKVSANSSTYQQALKAARDSTKELASQFSLASTQAKLFGSTTDQLKAKQQELTAKIKAQKEITSLHHTEVERLTKVLSDQKGRQQELAAQLQIFAYCLAGGFRRLDPAHIVTIKAGLQHRHVFRRAASSRAL